MTSTLLLIGSVVWLGYAVVRYTGDPEVREDVKQGFGVTVTTTETRAPGFRPFYLPGGAVLASLVLFAICYSAYRSKRRAYLSLEKYKQSRSARALDRESAAEE